MSDNSITRPGEPKAVAETMERLLEAERAGEHFLAEVRRRASELVEAAYMEAQTIDRRCSQRIDKLNKACGENNDRMVEAIDAEAQATATRATETASMRPMLRAAASRLAARLTGAES